ncbi:MAG: caspase family protein [Syntrophaceae bacterium]|nr:caspase family protein [Syntrophaceae bacterium]
MSELHLFKPAAAAAEFCTALFIGNGAYSSGPLKNPVNDAEDMAKALKTTVVTFRQG